MRGIITGIIFLLSGLVPVYLSCKYFKYYKVMHKQDYIAFILITIGLFWISGICIGSGILEVIMC